MEELTEAPCGALPKPQYHRKTGQSSTLKILPEHPRDLNFELVEECLPEDFLCADLEIKDRYHLIFAREEQLNTLAGATTWYIDGTIKLVCHPFKQLLTVNGFV